MNKHLFSPTRVAIAMIIMVTLGFVAQRLSKSGPAQTELQGITVIDPPLALAPFSLTDDRGAPFDRERLRGRWTFLFFGYAHCADVCPTAMTVLKQLKPLAGGADAGVQYVLVSVDPERDTPAKLGEYVRYFDPQFVGATGSHADLAKLTKPMGVHYARSGAGADYQVNHSSAIFLVDPQARLRGLLPQPHVPQLMAIAFAGVKK